ncbi:MAG: phage Gp37/Gp68 family protein, partial [Clostridiales bacterium]|nr:phage Gp37/Gp68 family protein [Clostridiales bacterium]
RKHGNGDSSVVTKTNGFYYPLAKERNGSYKIKSGELIRVCMTSDFFVEGADAWRNEAWNIMHERPDVKFFLLTKRPERVEKCLPKDWGDGLENVFFNVTCENQRRADERISILHELPFKHKGIMTAPLIGEISIEKYLSVGQIEQVICGGENYDGSRPCRYEWVKKLHDECVAADVTFAFIETGNYYVKDGKTNYIKSKIRQTCVAYSEGLQYRGKPVKFILTDRFGLPIPQGELYVPHYRANCLNCGNRLICNGCADCGKCDGRTVTQAEAEEYDRNKFKGRD